MLLKHPAHRSAHFEETQDFLSRKNLVMHFLELGQAAARRFDAKLNAIYGEALYIAYMEYGADIAIDAPAERGDYALSFPLGGEMAATARDEIVFCDKTETVISSPGRPLTVILSGNARRMMVSISADALQRRLTTLTGRTIPDQIEFEPMISLREGAGRLIADHIMLIANQEDGGTRAFDNPLVRGYFEDMVLTTLLLYQPHSHYGLIEQAMPAPAPADVRRVLDYIHTNFGSPLRLEHLVALANVPGRTLNEHFRRFVGFAPMAYLQKIRLEAARSALLSGEAPSVTEAAYRFGFTHLGRFAKAYQNAFGELPSETFRRGGR